MRFLLLGFSASLAFSLPFKGIVKESRTLPEIKISHLENPFPTNSKPQGFFYFQKVVSVKGIYSVGELLSLLSNGGINIDIEGNIDLNKKVFVSVTTKSVNDFIKTVCSSADIWCKYDPLTGKLTVSPYRYLTVNFDPEGSLTFSLGGEESGGSSQQGENKNLFNQSFAYRIANLDFPTFLEKLKSAFPDIRQIPSEKGFVIFRVTPSQYRELLRWVRERQKRTERLYADIELIRVDLNKNFQWGINWGGFTKFGDIGSLRTLNYQFTYLPITTGDAGKFVLVTKGGNERALFSWLSKYGKVYKVDSFYTQGVTGTPIPFRNYKLVRYFTVTVEQDQNGNAYPDVQINQDEVGFRGVLTIYKRGDGKYYVDGAVDISAVADWIEINYNGNTLKAPEITGKSFRIATTLDSLYSTIIVGGFRSKGYSGNTEATPGLSEIPGLGWLFKGKEDMKETSEFLVVIRLRPSREETEYPVWLEKVGDSITGESK